MKSIAITESCFHGHVSLEHGRGAMQPWRLWVDRKALFPSVADNCVIQASHPSGVRLRLRTNSPVLRLRVSPDRQAARAFDLVIDNALVQTCVLEAGQSSVTFDALPGKAVIAEIWLPSTAPVRVRGFGVADKASCAPARDPRRRWTAYGSSITKCGGALSPARIWTGVAARALDLNLTSLGLGGQCHLDPMYARIIRDIPADLITIKAGINIHGHGSLNTRSYRPALIGFVQTIRERQPQTPVILISPVCSPTRETGANAVGMSLTLMREEMKDAFSRLRKATGDRHLYYMDGLRLADAAFAARHMPDGLHPDGDGYVAMGRNFLAALPAALASSFQADPGAIAH